MDKTVSFEYYIRPLWYVVGEIRDKVEALLEFENSLNDACKMVSSELLENALKYGTCLKRGSDTRFEFTADEKQIRIEVSNDIYSEDDYKSLKDNIDQINASDNVRNLYIERLRLMMENTKMVKSQLGLYRITYEGKFKLSYQLEDTRLTITAIRELESKN
ncbi:hypothetical protein [Desulfonema magnum]|uniref:Histidine kinase/HSP90-like ATPase domain-containing protein n=1 Tax=Desulfonema magnum TaxID=45655 RepID=A0A975BTY8_9BACT|nr:hypothetical protein [Desulfonema magnum]QTA91090.1 Uncharacterized protein dnm_071550 [Desulfonema magnum]